MKRFKSSAMLLLCCLSIPIGSVMADEQESLTETEKFRETAGLMDIWIESVLDFDRLPGVSIAVVHDQDLVYSKGFGFADIKKGTKAAPDTRYCIASITKQFTAIAIMQLRDAGKLNLNDPVSSHLTWFAPNIDRTEVAEPTIEDVLTHSSGLPVEPDLTVWSDSADQFPPRAEFIARVKNINLTYPTGTKFHYSNTGYSLLGEIVSVVSGMDYVDYVQQYILDPLGLEDTTTNTQDRSFIDKAATGYGRWPRTGDRVELRTSIDWRAMTPAGGFGSTTEDLARFAMWQFRVLDGRDNQILKQETLQEMQAIHWENPKWGYGFTYWHLGDLDLIGYQGGTRGFKSQIILSPEEKVAVVVLFNAHDGPAWGTAMETYDLISRAIKAWKSGESYTKSSKWEKYTGYYTADDAWAGAEVLEWDGSLHLMWLPIGRPIYSLIELRHIEETSFRQVYDDSSLGSYFVFGTDDDGDISSMKFNNNIIRKAKR